MLLMFLYNNNLPIHEEKILQGNPMHEISTGMQMMHLQQQVAELTQLVKDAYEAILLIDEELKADKIGLLNAGYEGIQHALQHEGEQQLHELIVAQAQLTVRTLPYLSSIHTYHKSRWFSRHLLFSCAGSAFNKAPYSQFSPVICPDAVPRQAMMPCILLMPLSQKALAPFSLVLRLGHICP